MTDELEVTQQERDDALLIIERLEDEVGRLAEEVERLLREQEDALASHAASIKPLEEWHQKFHADQNRHQFRRDVP